MWGYWICLEVWICLHTVVAFCTLSIVVCMYLLLCCNVYPVAHVAFRFCSTCIMSRDDRFVFKKSLICSVLLKNIIMFNTLVKI